MEYIKCFHKTLRVYSQFLLIPRENKLNTELLSNNSKSWPRFYEELAHVTHCPCFSGPNNIQFPVLLLHSNLPPPIPVGGLNLSHHPAIPFNHLESVTTKVPPNKLSHEFISYLCFLAVACLPQTTSTWCVDPRITFVHKLQ